MDKWGKRLILLVTVLFLLLLALTVYDLNPVQERDGLSQYLFWQQEEDYSLKATQFKDLMASELREWEYSLKLLDLSLDLRDRPGEPAAEDFFSEKPCSWVLGLPVNRPRGLVEEISSSLAEIFQAQGGQILMMEEEEEGYHLRAGFLYGEQQIVSHSIRIKESDPQGQLALIIDDLGARTAVLEPFAPITLPLTMALLPHKPKSEEHALRADKMGFELLLHQPMEAANPHLDPGPGAITVGMERERVNRLLADNLASLPLEVVGVNNHMGSGVTAHRQTMGYVLDYLESEGLFFIDSSTTPDSVVPALAHQQGMPLLYNHFFIDNQSEVKMIKDSLVSAADRAQQLGQIILIGHARENTALAIKEALPLLEEEGIELIYVSEMVKGNH